MTEFFTIDNLSALLALTSLEIVLGIDNIVFIAILVARLDPTVQNKARLTGLALAMVTRILLLFAISWVMLLSTPIAFGLSGRSLILLFGGLFLIWKATHEIHAKIEGEEASEKTQKVYAKFSSVIIQILLIDIIFSLDSVITAVGMAQDVRIMVTSVIISVIVMMIFSGSITRFINRHPTFKVLALSFLILVGVLLVAEAFGKHLERGYVYFAMAFSIMVELVNIRIRPTHLPDKEV